MSFIDWMIKRKKPLSKMTRSELRRQELLLEKERNQLLKRVKKLADDKQDMFEKGSTEKTPEVRRILAQEFELKTTEQLMISRQLNVRSKEMLTVSRMRMIRENHERAKSAGSKAASSAESLAPLAMAKVWVMVPLRPNSVVIWRVFATK